VYLAFSQNDSQEEAKRLGRKSFWWRISF